MNQAQLMNKFLIVIFSLLQVFGNTLYAQNWKEKVSFVDGDTIKTYTVLNELPTNTISLKASVIGADTTFYFLYRDNQLYSPRNSETMKR